MNLITISVTCKNNKEAHAIADTLLKKNLIACANYWPIASKYRWHGRIQTAKEVMLVCKTMPFKKTVVVQQITHLHSYKVLVISIETVEVNQAAHQWAKRTIK